MESHTDEDNELWTQKNRLKTNWKDWNNEAAAQSPDLNLTENLCKILDEEEKQCSEDQDYSRAEWDTINVQWKTSDTTDDLLGTSDTSVDLLETSDV